ncbi:MAG: prolipoprotein diacylglyceryl transferase, partial [Oscillospiraceae bacterium]|nr:prolipoprotein diacylglyceryl transferase [Oscillospiraceae bacterium]
IPMLAMFDLTAMGFLIGQCIGRWGNFMNQEAFGGNTTLPWGMYSESTHSYLAAWQETLAGQGMTVDPALPVHPTFLYESLWCAVAFFILFAFMKKRRFNGELLLLYIILYGAERFVVEGLRTDALIIPGLGLRVSQVVALGSVAVALVLEVVLRRKYKGQTLTVELAVEDLKFVPIEGFEPQSETSLPASAPHKDFAAKTKALNEERKALKEAQKKAGEAPAQEPEIAPEKEEKKPEENPENP